VTVEETGIWWGSKHGTREEDGQKEEKACLLTLVIPFDVGMGGHDGAHHTGLRLVGLVIRFGVGRRHGEG
jgi:hypothetical protein